VEDGLVQIVKAFKHSTPETPTVGNTQNRRDGNRIDKYMGDGGVGLLRVYHVINCN
jgi:hypothetical protein